MAKVARSVLSLISKGEKEETVIIIVIIGGSKD